MVFSELEAHLASLGLTLDEVAVEDQPYVVIRDLEIRGGTHRGEVCDLAIRRSTDDPWVPEAALHVKPHLIEMGQNATLASPLGAEWQYLSRRFDRPPTPKTFYAYIHTVLGEL